MINLLLGLPNYIKMIASASISALTVYGVMSMTHAVEINTLNSKILDLTTKNTSCTFRLTASENNVIKCTTALAKSIEETKKANKAITDVNKLYNTLKSKKENENYVKETCTNGSDFNVSIRL